MTNKKNETRLSIPTELRDELKALAAKENRSMVGLIREMLKDRKSA